MKFRMIKPFVMELIIFIVVIGGVFYGLLAENFIEIKIRAHLLTVTAFLIVIVSLLTLFSRIVNTGIRALIDFVFQHTREDNYVFLEEKPYVASVFTEKVNHERERSYGMYYLVYVRKSEKVYTFLSPIYVEMTPNETYTIRTGYFSKILLKSKLINN